MKKGEINSLDSLFEVLATKVDMKTGEDLILKDQVNQLEKKQSELQQTAIKQQLIVQKCLEMRKNLNKHVYKELMAIFGMSYSPQSMTDNF